MVQKVANTQPPAFRKGARTIRPSNNPAKNDLIIADWLRRIDIRYGRLKTRITKLVKDQNVFGLKKGAVTNAALDFSRGSDPVRIDRFMTWLRKQEKSGAIDILPAIHRKGYWTEPLIRQNFIKGGNVASNEVRALTRGTSIGTNFSIPVIGRTGKSVNALMAQPQSIARIRMIQTRTLNGVRGITQTMNNQIFDVIGQGFLDGISPTQMARNIVDRVDKIGITRARLIARTESTEAYGEGALAEFQNVSGIIGETVLSQWWATLDSRVRRSHFDRHGKIFTDEQMRILLGEPNCRCSPLPYIESIEGKATLSKASTFTNAAIVVMGEDYWQTHDWSQACECCSA